MGGGAGRGGPREVDVALNPEELPGSPIGGGLRKELMGKVPPDGEPGVARVRVDEDVLMHLANALGPRRHTHLFMAQTCMSAAGLVILIAIAIGGIIKLDQLNEQIGALTEIQVRAPPSPPPPRRNERKSDSPTLPPAPTTTWIDPLLPHPPHFLTRGLPPERRKISRRCRLESRRCQRKWAT